VGPSENNLTSLLKHGFPNYIKIESLRLIENDNDNAQINSGS